MTIVANCYCCGNGVENWEVEQFMRVEKPWCGTCVQAFDRGVKHGKSLARAGLVKELKERYGFTCEIEEP